jgi:hypothetical protein
MPLSAIVQLYHGGRIRSTRRDPPTMGKYLFSLYWIP